MKLRNARLAAMLAAVLVIGVLASAYGFFDRKGHAQSTTTPGPTHVSAITYYSTKGDWNSTLTFNNASRRALTASCTLFALDGSPLTLPDVLLQPFQNKAVSLKELTSQSSDPVRFQEGSL